MWMPRAIAMVGTIVGLLLFATPAVSLAAAEWVRVGGTHKYDRYVDVTTIGVSGANATLWTLRDFRVERAIPGGAYRSLKIKRQYDCDQRKSRHLHVRYYPEALAQGRVLYARKKLKKTNIKKQKRKSEKRKEKQKEKKKKERKKKKTKAKLNKKKLKKK